MKKNFATLFLLFIFSVCPERSIAQSSDVLNSVIFLRNTSPVSGLLPCSKSTRGSQSYCPIVASNCPSAFPVCSLVAIRKYATSTRTYPTCVCSTGFQTNAPIVSPCSSGNSCTPKPIVTPTPRPTATPRPTVTPTPVPTVTPTPVPTVTPTPVPTIFYLEGENYNTGGKAQNGQSLFARVGDSIQYRWGASSAVNGYSQYRIVSGPNNCGWANPGVWYNYPMGGAGGWLASVQQCQSGTTYEITYSPVNSFGQVIGTRNLFVVVQ